MGESSHNNPDLTRWKRIGLLSTALILISLPLYLIRVGSIRKSSPRLSAGIQAGFVGSEKCRPCHKNEHDKWSASHHRFAMETAREETVLGDFNDARFEKFGIVSRFYKKDGKFFVHTQGPEGKMGDFEITHTFGWHPLQQYLVPFPGGRLQCLPIAWDVNKAKWYHLYPDQVLDPSEWLFWTNSGLNWNGMCAECHSTNLKKNYDPKADAYRTTWSEISVGCEACHGPGSEHVRWAQTPEMGRPIVEHAGLLVKTRGLTSKEQIELCAPCHSRRMSLGDNPHRNIDFMDYAIPQLLSEGYYFADGQILEEVYVYGSFMQSKMYARQVRCSDCHDVHGIGRVREGNDLCLQCHRASDYDTREHHFHKKKGEKGDPIRSASGEILFDVGTGARCEQCHMPGRFYMGVDYRPDHSFRIPMPELGMKTGSPNACNRCHMDKNVQWSIDSMSRWYGQKKRAHYGTLLHAGRRHRPEALSGLIRLAEDRLYPPIVRATALSLAAGYPGEEAESEIKRALSDEESLVRYTSLRHLAEPDLEKRLLLAGPLLYDPVKAVRIEAAQALSVVSSQVMPEMLRSRFEQVLFEYENAMMHTADFAQSRHNLGNLYAALGQGQTAVENYRKAIDIDHRFYPAKVNLAMLYNRMGQNDPAEALLREVVSAQPGLFEIQYSLGLLLAEKKKFSEAVNFLEAAAKGLPSHARIRYNLGLLYQQLNRESEAEKTLKKALEMDPDSRDYLWALADFYLKRQKLAEAKPLAERMVNKHPDQAVGHDLLRFIDGQTNKKPSMNENPR